MSKQIWFQRLNGHIVLGERNDVTFHIKDRKADTFYKRAKLSARLISCECYSKSVQPVNRANLSYDEGQRSKNIKQGKALAKECWQHIQSGMEQTQWNKDIADKVNKILISLGQPAPQSELQTRYKQLDMLNKSLSKIDNPQIKVKLQLAAYGSILTGSLTSDSDLDLILLSQDANRAPVCPLTLCSPYLLTKILCTQFEKDGLLAKPPDVITLRNFVLIKLVLARRQSSGSSQTRQLQCDIIIGNADSLLRSHFMRVVADAYPQVLLLQILLKKWANNSGLKDSARRSQALTTYAMFNIVSLYAQTAPSPFLPSYKSVFYDCGQWLAQLKARRLHRYDSEQCFVIDEEPGCGQGSPTGEQQGNVSRGGEVSSSSVAGSGNERGVQQRDRGQGQGQVGGAGETSVDSGNGSGSVGGGAGFDGAEESSEVAGQQTERSGTVSHDGQSDVGGSSEQVQYRAQQGGAQPSLQGQDNDGEGQRVVAQKIEVDEGQGRVEQVGSEQGTGDTQKGGGGGQEDKSDLAMTDALRCMVADKQQLSSIRPLQGGFQGLLNGGQIDDIAQHQVTRMMDRVHVALLKWRANNNTAMGCIPPPGDKQSPSEQTMSSVVGTIQIVAPNYAGDIKQQMEQVGTIARPDRPSSAKSPANPRHTITRIRAPKVKKKAKQKIVHSRAVSKDANLQRPVSAQSSIPPAPAVESVPGPAENVENSPPLVTEGVDVRPMSVSRAAKQPQPVRVDGKPAAKTGGDQPPVYTQPAGVDGRPVSSSSAKQATKGQGGEQNSTKPSQEKVGVTSGGTSNSVGSNESVDQNAWQEIPHNPSIALQLEDLQRSMGTANSMVWLPQNIQFNSTLRMFYEVMLLLDWATESWDTTPTALQHVPSTWHGTFVKNQLQNYLIETQQEYYLFVEDPLDSLNNVTRYLGRDWEGDTCQTARGNLRYSIKSCLKALQQLDGSKACYQTLCNLFGDSAVNVVPESLLNEVKPNSSQDQGKGTNRKQNRTNNRRKPGKDRKTRNKQN